MAPPTQISAARGLFSSLPIAVLFVSALLLLFLAVPPARAQSTATLTIYNQSNKYKYQGCYNETIDIAGSADNRALADGTHTIGEGSMTVPLCLSYCSSNGTTYKYAGVEYSRECWCASHISALSTKMTDADCNTACDGDMTEACGGPLKLSVYMISAGPMAYAFPRAVPVVAGFVTLLFWL